MVCLSLCLAVWGVFRHESFSTLKQHVKGLPHALFEALRCHRLSRARTSCYRFGVCSCSCGEPRTIEPRTIGVVVGGGLNCACLNRGSWWQPLDYLRRLKVHGSLRYSCVFKAIPKVRIRSLLLSPLPPGTSFSTPNKKMNNKL